jgi:hypothetical protein
MDDEYAIIVDRKLSPFHNGGLPCSGDGCVGGLSNETALSGRAACESDRRCQVKIEDWGYIFAYSFNGVFDEVVTSPDGVGHG